MTFPCDALRAYHNENRLIDIDANDQIKFTISLDNSRNTSYQDDDIRICAPDGRILREFNKESLADKEHKSTPQKSLFFVAHLFSHINELQLPEETIRSIEDLVIRFYL